MGTSEAPAESVLGADPERAHGGAVVLDIGGDVGAAVVYVGDSLNGRELEIRGAGEPWAGVHTGVWQRTVVEDVVWAGVFGSLPAGEYEVRVLGDATTTSQRLTVSGGAVTSLTYPTVTARPRRASGRP
jgi:hypothetical protein